MDKVQEEKFAYKWEYYKGKQLEEGSKNIFKAGFEACLEANGITGEQRIPEGYYKPGEIIEIRDKGSNGDFMSAQIVILNRDAILVNHNRIEVRRIPAWTPKEGEAVFALYGDRVLVARVLSVNGDGLTIDYDGRVCLHKVSYRGNTIFAKPFDASKIGKPWSEI